MKINNKPKPADLVGKKQTRLAYVKAINPEEKSITSYVSTFGFDRMEERFAKGAWQLVNFKKNPVVLWMHGFGLSTPIPPIAKSEHIDEDETGLLTKMIFDKESEFAMQIFSLYERGFLNAFSVGFIPKEFEMEPLGDNPDRKGLVWTVAELLEYSAVDIPANPGALVPREVADVARKVMKDSITVVKTLDQDIFIAAKSQAVTEAITLMAAGAKPEEPDFADSLKAIVGLARMVKGKKVPESQLTLVKTASDLFVDIIEENQDEATPEQIDALLKSVEDLGEIVAEAVPTQKEIIRKTLLQIRKAVK